MNDQCDQIEVQQTLFQPQSERWGNQSVTIGVLTTRRTEDDAVGGVDKGEGYENGRKRGECEAVPTTTSTRGYVRNTRFSLAIVVVFMFVFVFCFASSFYDPTQTS
jgi:hypothetical protein